MTAAVEWVPSCTSTNALLHSRTDRPHGYTLAAVEQTAGRGQRGNSWEAEPGANLTFSMLLRPQAVPAQRQFELSMLVALAVADVVRAELGVAGSDVAVKWPNDIYVADSKICGMLIENSLSGGAIHHSIAGVGVNVNQRRFLSDAPNPVSMIQLDGRLRPLEPLMQRMADAIAAAVAHYDGSPAQQQQLMARYRNQLWHGTGSHSYHEPGGVSFRASVVAVGADGMLTLSNGRTYAFKEVIQEV